MRASIVFPRACLLALLTTAILSTLVVCQSYGQDGNSPPSTNQKWNYGELQKVPEKYRAKSNPMESDPDSIRAGGKLFQRSCASCHGMKAEGGHRGPSLIKDEVQQAAPGAIFWILTNGVIRHGMPDWSKLPEAQRWQIIAFLKSIKTPHVAGSAGGDD